MSDPQKIYIAYVEHWQVPGAIMRAFADRRKADGWLVKIFNEDLLSELNEWREDNELTVYKPVTSIEIAVKLVKQHNEEADKDAVLRIHQVDYEP